MEFKNIIEKTTTTVKYTSKNITDRYNQHVRKKAIEKVAKRLKVINLSPSDINEDDYETMLCDAQKDIKLNYAKKTAQVGFTLLGLDLLFGI